jgi:hypothetical protein
MTNVKDSLANSLIERSNSSLFVDASYLADDWERKDISSRIFNPSSSDIFNSNSLSRPANNLSHIDALKAREDVYKQLKESLFVIREKDRDIQSFQKQVRIKSPKCLEKNISPRLNF